MFAPLNKKIDDLDKLFKRTNELFHLIAVREARITKQASLTTNIIPEK